jgi:hypothetical protein
LSSGSELNLSFYLTLLAVEIFPASSLPFALCV